MSFEINRRLAAPRPALPTGAEIDSVTADIIRGAFETICYEVATHLGRSASSAIIRSCPVSPSTHASRARMLTPASLTFSVSSASRPTSSATRASICLHT